jgi:hypothetical protein
MIASVAYQLIVLRVIGNAGRKSEVERPKLGRWLKAEIHAT